MQSALLFLVLCTLTLAEPYSPFNRNKAQPDNYTPVGMSLDPSYPRNTPGTQRTSSTPKFDVVYQWRVMDFEYPSAEAKRQALATG